MSQSKETKKAIAEFWASTTKHKPASKPRLSQGLKDSHILIAMDVGTGIPYVR